MHMLQEYLDRYKASLCLAEFENQIALLSTLWDFYEFKMCG